VISAPVHVQDFPSRYAPQMGFEGANVMFDTWIAPLMMGLEEHLLTMFREDFEFHQNAPASHLGRSGGVVKNELPAYYELDKESSPEVETEQLPVEKSVIGQAVWTQDALKELGKIPFFVRGKARKNTEKFAVEQGMQEITLETLYDAKAYYSK
jgi:light-independent protochlorophyllide reductase subunit B